MKYTNKEIKEFLELWKDTDDFIVVTKIINDLELKDYITDESILDRVTLAIVRSHHEGRMSEVRKEISNLTKELKHKGIKL
jgi:hypothetical protein